MKVNGPTPPLLIFVKVTVGRLSFVKVQAILDPGAVAAASSNNAPVARFGVAVPPLPKPVQVVLLKTYPAGMASEIVVAVEAAVKVCETPETPVPAVAVVIVWLAHPLLPVNVNGPTPPLLILVSATVGSLLLVKVQTIVAPGAVPNALI